MTISEKAKQLYLDCDNTDPNMSMLMPYRLEKIEKRNIYFAMLIGQLINKYALEDFEDDWLEYSRETFYIGKQDKEGWSSVKSTVYRLEKKGYVETKFENGMDYIRLANGNDDIFDVEIYKRQ